MSDPARPDGTFQEAFRSIPRTTLKPGRGAPNPLDGWRESSFSSKDYVAVSKV